MIDHKVVKSLILSTAYKANKGHIGSALSVADLVLVTTTLVVNNSKVEMVLSKGHAALSYYCVLKELGIITSDELDSYCGDHSLFGTHPDPGIPFVNFVGGSLGQGISFGVGKAYAFKTNSENKKVIVIASDSELNSGVFWESIGLAATNKLNNLYIVMDNNNQQALGHTKDIVNYPALDQTIQSLDFDVSTIDGHNLNSIESALHQVSEKPKFIIANTKFGGGISFMQGIIDWHYLPLNKEQYELALTEVNT